MDNNEIWIGVKRFENYYMVSNFGRIKRLPRWSKNSRNNTYKILPERINKIGKRNNIHKYISINLMVNGIGISVQLHKLILSSFISQPFEKAEVNHKNGNKHDNKLENLEWVTSSENKQHAIKNGWYNFAKGEKSGNAKITKNIVKEIRELHKNNFNYIQISNKLKITIKIIGDICRGRTWRHV